MNFEEETRNGYLITEKQKRIWNIQMQLLNKVLDVCDRYGLRVWAEGGTLLGAVRHKGYIPWDDDIDLSMFRDDYNKLLAIADKEFKFPFFLQTAYSDKEYLRGHAQFRMSGTSAILPSDIWADFHQGIFIDIFVYDYLPVEGERHSVFSALEKKRAVMHEYVYGSAFCRMPWIHINNSLKIFFAGGLKPYFRQFESIILNHKNKETKQVGDVLWTSHNYHKYMHESEWHENTVYLPFEDIKIPVPVGYEKILTRQYGDYMTPVQAPSCHGEVKFDINSDYKVKLREMRLNKPLREKLHHPLKWIKALLKL